MKNFDPKSILAIAAGVAGGIGVFFVLALIGFFSGMMTWGSGVSHGISTADIISGIIITISGLAAGWASSFIANKSKILHAMITGVILVLLLIFVVDLNIKQIDLVLLLLCFGSSIIGGWIATKK